MVQKKTQMCHTAKNPTIYYLTTLRNIYRNPRAHNIFFRSYMYIKRMVVPMPQVNPPGQRSVVIGIVCGLGWGHGLSTVQCFTLRKILAPQATAQIARVKTAKFGIHVTLVAHLQFCGTP